MTGGEQSASDIAALEPYERQFENMDLIKSIMDHIDTYGDEIDEYLKRGKYEDLADFLANLNATECTLTAEITHLVTKLASSEDVPAIISKLAELYRYINKIYLAAVGSSIFCESCVDSCIDIDGAPKRMYGVLSDPTTLGYNPEKVVSVFTDGINCMNAHLLRHLSQE